jgi:recombinational DNA repair ATPase RecF
MNELVPTTEVSKYIELIRKRDELLRQKPHLKEVQNKIDETLKTVGNDPVERCQVIQHIMIQSAYQLQAHFDELVEMAPKIDVTINKLKEIAEKLNST